MTPEELAAVAVARRKRDLTHPSFDEDTQFVENVLVWILEERANNRLVDGLPATFVLYDFAPGPAELGDVVRLKNGGVVQGAIHLCALGLRTANLVKGTGALGSLDAHEEMLVNRQHARRTSVTFNPTTSEVTVRLACAPMAPPVGMKLASSLAAGWAGNGLTPVTAALNWYHATMTLQTGIGPLLFDAGIPKREMRIRYRNAVYLFLRFELGLTQQHGYRVSVDANGVRVRELVSDSSVSITASADRSGDPSVAAAALARIFRRADRLYGIDGTCTHVSCLCCSDQRGPGEERGKAPHSFRHRHFEAA